MNSYKVTICRVEHTIYEFNVLGDDEKDAENTAWKLHNGGYEADNEDVVHAEEFVHQTDEIENNVEVV